jgi:hypothetical protein
MNMARIKYIPEDGGEADYFYSDAPRVNCDGRSYFRADLAAAALQPLTRKQVKDRVASASGLTTDEFEEAMNVAVEKLPVYDEWTASQERERELAERAREQFRRRREDARQAIQRLSRFISMLARLGNEHVAQSISQISLKGADAFPIEEVERVIGLANITLSEVGVDHR